MGELEARLIAELRASPSGTAMRFDRFMERALFEPELGYYTRPGARVGREGDFVTSPVLSGAFGRTLASLAVRVRTATAGSGPFRIVDAGAGEGALLATLLGELKVRGVVDGIEGVLIERGPALRQRARERVAGLGVPVTALADVHEAEQLSAMPSLVIANELADALPVRRFRCGSHGETEEAYVEASGSEQLREVWRAVAAAEHAPRVQPRRERCVAPGLPALVRALGTSVASGLLLLIDYGWPACLIDGEDSAGNAVRGFRGGTLVDDLVALPGEVDLTAHVDFSAANRAALDAGLSAVFFTDQTYLLLGLGFLDDPEAVRAQRLIHPEDLGGAFRCLGMARGMVESNFADLGLRDRRPLLSR